MGGTHRQKKNNIISHKQYYHEFVPLDEHYQANNIEGWDLSGEPTYLVELTKDYHVDIKNTTNVYIQQVAFHSQFSISVYKVRNPDIMAPGSTRIPQWTMCPLDLDLTKKTPLQGQKSLRSLGTQLYYYHKIGLCSRETYNQVCHTGRKCKWPIQYS